MGEKITITEVVGVLVESSVDYEYMLITTTILINDQEASFAREYMSIYSVYDTSYFLN